MSISNRVFGNPSTGVYNHRKPVQVLDSTATSLPINNVADGVILEEDARALFTNLLGADNNKIFKVRKGFFVVAPDGPDSSGNPSSGDTVYVVQGTHGGQLHGYDGMWELLDLDIDATGDVDSASNVGGGHGVFKQKVSKNLHFKTLSAGDDIIITPIGDSLEIGVDSDVRTQINNKLDLSGGEMSGILDMGSNKITDLDSGDALTDAMNKAYIDGNWNRFAVTTGTATPQTITLSNLPNPNPLVNDPVYNQNIVFVGSGTATNTLIMADPSNMVLGKIYSVTNRNLGLLNIYDHQGRGIIIGLGQHQQAYLRVRNLTSAAAVPPVPVTNGSVLYSQSILPKYDSNYTYLSIGNSLQTKKISFVSDPTAPQDVATKIYVDNQDTLQLNLAGGTMVGNISMGGTNKIVSLADGVALTDAATKHQRDRDGGLEFNTVAGTVTLTDVSAQNQSFGASGPYTCILPDPANYVIGKHYILSNRSAGDVIVKDHTGATISTLKPNQRFQGRVRNLASAPYYGTTIVPLFNLANTFLDAGTKPVSNMGLGVASTDAARMDQLAAKLTATQAAAQADSASIDVLGLSADFNALLAKLRAAGIIAP